MIDEFHGLWAAEWVWFAVETTGYGFYRYGPWLGASVPIERGLLHRH